MILVSAIVLPTPASAGSSIVPEPRLAVPHEHAFYAHEDPRWLICDCGQFAVRSRTVAGEASVRLIETPHPALAGPAPAAPARLPQPRPATAPIRVPIGASTAQPDVPAASRCRTVLASVSDFVVEVDPVMIVRWASPSLTDVLGWRPDEWVGTPASRWFPDLTDAESWQILARILHGESVAGLRRVLAADGTECWVDRAANPLRDWTGEVVAVVTAFHLLARPDAPRPA